jgi:hypothetical protein
LRRSHHTLMHYHRTCSFLSWGTHTLLQTGAILAISKCCVNWNAKKRTN